MMGNLKQYQLPVKVGDCLDYLRSLQLQTILLELYGELFPIQWSNSTIPLFQQSHPTVYTDREIEFLQLLNTWFPIEYYEELETIEERYTEIYIYPQNISWWNQTFEELSQVEQFIISLLDWFFRTYCAKLLGKCQNNKALNSKLRKFLKPNPQRLSNFNLLLIPSTIPLVVRFSKYPTISANHRLIVGTLFR